MDSVTSGNIGLNTDDRVIFASSDLDVTMDSGSKLLTATYTSNKGSLGSQRIFSIDIDPAVTSGRYSFPGVHFPSGTYTEFYKGPNGESKQHQYEAKGGEVQITVTKTEGANLYALTRVDASMDRTTDNKTRTVDGYCVLHIDRPFGNNP